MIHETSVNLINRRSFLFNSISVLVSIPLIGNLFFATQNQIKVNSHLDKVFLVNFKLLFPREMTFEESENFKTLYENKDLTHQLIDAFIKRGYIKDHKYDFHGSYSNWTVAFQDESSFKRWLDLSWKLKTISKDPHDVPGLKLQIEKLNSRNFIQS